MWMKKTESALAVAAITDTGPVRRIVGTEYLLESRDCRPLLGRNLRALHVSGTFKEFPAFRLSKSLSSSRTP